jgi:hypothetical protein
MNTARGAASDERPAMSGEKAPLSDFYVLRRLTARDVGGLIGFVTGFLGALPTAGVHLKRDWLAGFVNRAMLHFILIEFGIAVAAGALGYLLGDRLWAVWQRWHQGRRR